MIDRELSVDLHAYLVALRCFLLPRSCAWLIVGRLGLIVCAPVSRADRWTQVLTVVQPEKGCSISLWAATAILPSCQSQAAWLTLSVVLPLAVEVCPDLLLGRGRKGKTVRFGEKNKLDELERMRVKSILATNMQAKREAYRRE